MVIMHALHKNDSHNYNYYMHACSHIKSRPSLILNDKLNVYNIIIVLFL